MDSKKQPPLRRTSRVRKRSSKGADADLDAKHDSPIMTPPKDVSNLDGSRVAKRAAASPTPATDKTLGRPLGAALKNGADKASGKSNAGRRNTLLPYIDAAAFAQPVSHDPAKEYKLPSFHNYPIGAAVALFRDGADDNWEDFCGNIDDYRGGLSAGSPDTIMAQAVASTFVSRARAAKSVDQSWEEFADTERSIDSSATTEKNMRKRAQFLRDALDNGLRMAIFEKIAERLCVEIFQQTWSYQYPERTATVGLGHAAEIRSENYESDPDRTTTGWSSGGPSGAVPAFDNDDVSVSSVEVELTEEDWMPQEE